MEKTIWSCWLQGRQQAPELVRKCLQTWEDRNSRWKFRILDAGSISRYINLSAYLDLSRQIISPQALTDTVRLLLLYEYGGVWVDATTYCNAPLDDWLPHAAHTGFFAFSRPFAGYPLANWFLAADPDNTLIRKCAMCAVKYWKGRVRNDHYGWFQYQFGELCAVDRAARRAWEDVPQIRIDGPLSILAAGMYEDFDTASSRIDWTAPLFKLTYRRRPSRLPHNCFAARFLGLAESEMAPQATTEVESQVVADPMGLVDAAQSDLDDHIQVIAAEDLLRRAGLAPTFTIDPDGVIAPSQPNSSESAPRVMISGTLKRDISDWSCRSRHRPAFLGFHIPRSHAANLTSASAVDYYAAHAPVGCGDRYTLSLLRALGVDAFLSHHLSIIFARRLPDPQRQTEVFVVSRDRRILNYVSASIGHYTFINPHSDSHDIHENRREAAEMLELYSKRARLVITTMPHCALAVIAMGIPVVVFYPKDDEPQLDMEKFSSLSEIVRVFRAEESTVVNWRGYTLDVSALKLRLLDSFFAMAARWGPLAPPHLAPTAPSSWPVDSYPQYLADPDRIARLARAEAPDRQKWGTPASYTPKLLERAQLAARFIRDGSRVLEIGTGSGTLRTLIAHRTQYTGADLEPLDQSTFVFDLDSDEIPLGTWDTIVLLEVLEYTYHTDEALRKISNATSHLVISYCCHVDRQCNGIDERRQFGWTNAMTEQNILEKMAALGFHASGREPFNSTSHFDQIIFEFSK